MIVELADESRTSIHGDLTVHAALHLHSEIMQVPDDGFRGSGVEGNKTETVDE